jgi:hypothetical protein
MGHSCVATVGNEKEADRWVGAWQVVPSRIIMAVPNMGLTPVIMGAVENRGLLRAYPFLNLPLTTLVTG